LWRSRLKELWQDRRVSVQTIGQKLGVDSKTVKKHAMDLGLPFPRQAARMATAIDLYKKRPRASPYSIHSQRQAWLALRRENPSCGVKDLRALHPRLFIWLYRHDRVWLDQNKPARKRTLARPAVDWASRDAELVEHVANAALRIKNRSGRPTRVSLTAIGRVLGNQTLLQTRLHKMHLTRAMILSVVETAEAFSVRRVRQAAARLRLISPGFRRWELVRAAGLRRQMEDLPAVQAALDYEMLVHISVGELPRSAA